MTPLALGSLVPNVVVWVELRTLLGLYPGYGLGQVEEFRRQMFALFATLAITTIFAFGSHTDDSLSRMLLRAWVTGLLLFAPIARYCVKLGMINLNPWGKPVVVLGTQGTGARIL